MPSTTAKAHLFVAPSKQKNKGTAWHIRKTIAATAIICMFSIVCIPKAFRWSNELHTRKPHILQIIWSNWMPFCQKKTPQLCHKMKVWHLPDSIFGSLCWEDWENDKAEVTTSNRWHISKPIDSKIDANLIDCKSILASVTQVVQFKTCPVQHTASWVNQNMNTHWDIEHANPSFRHAHFSICDHHVTKMEVLISLQTVHHNHWHTTWCSILFLFCTTLVCLSFLVIPMRSAASKWCTPSFSHLCSISCLQWFQKMHNWFKQEMHLKTC